MISIRTNPLLKVLFALSSCASLLAAPFQEVTIEEEGVDPQGISINFPSVPAQEFVKFVSRVSNVNFIYDDKDLHFNVTLSSGKPVTPESVVKALIQILRVRGLYVIEQDGYFVIHRNEAAEQQRVSDSFDVSHLSVATGGGIIPFELKQREFMVHKLQYQQGSEVEAAIKKVGQDLQTAPDAPQKLLRAIQSLQWVKATNSILASGDEATLASLKKLIASIDVPLKQVFIEVLVIETDVRNSLDFGLEWSANGSWDNKVGMGVGNFAPSRNPPGPFARGMQGAQGGGLLDTLSKIPLATGFNLGVIGNTILHKGKAFFSLGSLVSALQIDGDTTIVLNQKIITQDNKNSKIFVGDNIPFTGSVTQTVGASEQTTSNIEYRDVGVSLSITPMLGDDDVITLEIQQEITEALPDMESSSGFSAVGGIRTTKTDMSTQVHVPDQHFLVLTGMIRNHRHHRKTGIPCLGGLPFIGAAFSKTHRNDDKKNVIVYVRPQIVHSIDDYKRITQSQEDLFRQESAPADFDRGLDLIVE